MRRLLILLVLASPVAALPAFAQEEGPVVDVVEVAGAIDRPMERYILEQIDQAERDGVALLVFQINSLGGMKVRERAGVPEIVRRIQEASVPVAVHIGPRRGRAGGLAVAMAVAADVGSVGPSSRVGPLLPVDLAEPERYADLVPEGAPARAVLGANAAREAGLADQVLPSVAELLRRLDGQTVQTAVGARRMALPPEEVVVRFHQPGPVRRLLHTFSNAILVYVVLLAGALLVVFELFQPGFGVAGVTGAILLLGGGYGLTVLPARGLGLALVIAGLLLLTLDVAIDRLGPPTVVGALALLAGSPLLFPRTSEATRLSPWLIGSALLAALVFFVPGMTVVRRARAPIAREVREELLGEQAEVRSVLNPEGFVLLAGELWRARSQDGSKVRVGESVVVAGVDGTVLLVAPVPSGNGL